VNGMKRATALASALAATAAVSMAVAGQASADTTGVPGLLLGSGGWTYQQQATQLPYNATPMTAAGDAAFAQPGADVSGYSTGGTAPFSNNALCGFVGHTGWAASTDMLLRHDVTLPAGAYNVHISGTIDNDASIFLNGQNVGVTNSGNCLVNSINLAVPQSVVQPGASNLLAVRAHDSGGATYLDVALTYSLDTTAPVLTVPSDITAEATSAAGAVVTYSATASDAVDPNPTVSCSTPSGSTFPLGTTTASCTAVDAAGNTRAAQTFTVSVAYQWNGFLQPINDTAHQVGTAQSVFKAGSTVPVKLQLQTADGTAVQGATAPVFLGAQKGSAMSAAVDETLYTDPSTTGSTFRWDATSQQYIFNWATSKAQAGYWWRIAVALPDGSTQYVVIGLR
jgi:hypothetical protein